MTKKRRGDRRDATLVRDIDAFHSFMVHMMPNRADAEVYLHAEIDVTDLMDFIAEKNKMPDARQKITVFHAVVAAVARVIVMRPKLNRYVSGGRFYDRDYITMSFVAKKQFTDHAEEAMMILKPENSFTLDDFSAKITGDVNEARTGGDEYGADGALNILQKFPVWVNRLVMAAMRWMDRHGCLPDGLYYVDPNQTTVLLSNLGSIKCDAVYHHLNNYGSNSMIITIGEIKRMLTPFEGGEPRWRSIMPIGVTVDERIADGFYFAKCIKIIEHILLNPKILDMPLGEELVYEK